MEFKGLRVNNKSDYNVELELSLMESGGVDKFDINSVIRSNGLTSVGKRLVRRALLSGIKFTDIASCLKKLDGKEVSDVLDGVDYGLLLNKVQPLRRTKTSLYTGTIPVYADDVDNICLLGCVENGVLDCIGTKMKLPVKNGLYIVLLRENDLNVVLVDTSANFVLPVTNRYNIVSDMEMSMFDIRVPYLLNDINCNIVYVSSGIINGRDKPWLEKATVSSMSFFDNKAKSDIERDRKQFSLDLRTAEFYNHSDEYYIDRAINPCEIEDSYACADKEVEQKCSELGITPLEYHLNLVASKGRSSNINILKLSATEVAEVLTERFVSMAEESKNKGKASLKELAKEAWKEVGDQKLDFSYNGMEDVKRPIEIIDEFHKIAEKPKNTDDNES